jgi:NADH dehydrogenase [ubiquinone] 1 alpha subcomplex assembly factor 6
MAQKLSYCGQLVKDHDPDRFLISLFAPLAAREDLWALFAFNHEIAKTREVVSETVLGQARLQWWREAVGTIYDGGDVPEHEVLKGLARAVKAHDLPREDFETLIYAREFDLENVLPANTEGFLHYADFTSTPLMRMAVKIAGGDPEREPVPQVAVNYALAGLLRAVPFHAGQRRCYLPEELMKKHGVSLLQLHDFMKPEEGLKDLVRELAGQFVKGVKPEDRMLGAAQALASIYMKQLEKAGYDPFDSKAIIPPYFKELRVFLAA